MTGGRAGTERSGGTMANDQFDLALAALFTASAATTVGIADVTVLNISLSEIFTTIAGVDITVAMMASILALAGGWFINQPSLDALGSEQRMLVGATLALVVALAASADLASWVTGDPLIGIAVMAVESGGFYSIALEG